jgi:dipeptidyl-peptidase 4
VTMYAHLIRPAGFQPGTKYPAIVSVYGGPGAQSVTNSWGGLSTDQLFAHQGYVVWKLDNRGTAGRGTGWQFAVYRNLGAVEMQDQARGVEHLLSLGFVDPGRIGIHGWSYGGFMTLNALLHRPNLFSAGVAGAPVTDFRLYDTIYTERYMGLPSENEENYRQGAPVTHASKLEGALLLVHNLQDDNVHFQNTVLMADALARAGKPFYTMFYSLKTHGVSGELRPQMLETMLRFFNTELKRSNPHK